MDKGEKVERILIEKTTDFDEDERKACVKLWMAVARRRRMGEVNGGKSNSE